MNLARSLSWTIGISFLLAACGEPVTGPMQPVTAGDTNEDTPASVPAPVIETAPELSFLFAETQTGADGVAVAVTGLYHVFDTSNRQVDVCHAAGAKSTCSRYPLDRELGIQPMAVSVKGAWQGGRVVVADWQALPFSWADAAAACGRTLKEHADRLGQIDWGAAALPAYRESSATFKLDAAALSTFAYEPAGFDPDQQRFIIRGKGPLLPEQSPLVKRWALLYCIGNSGDLRVTHIVATIEGFAEEH
jgi:hypothetical protein